MRDEKERHRTLPRRKCSPESARTAGSTSTPSRVVSLSRTAWPSWPRVPPVRGRLLGGGSSMSVWAASPTMLIALVTPCWSSWEVKTGTQLVFRDPFPKLPLLAASPFRLFKSFPYRLANVHPAAPGLPDDDGIRPSSPSRTIAGFSAALAVQSPDRLRAVLWPSCGKRHKIAMGCPGWISIASSWHL